MFLAAKTRSVLLLAVSIVVLAAIGFGASPEAISQTAVHGTLVRGEVTMTSGCGGLLTFITVPGPEQDKPLTAAFVIQHRSPGPHVPDYTGEALFIYQVTEKGSLLSVLIEPQEEDTKGWYFRIDRYGGSAPQDATLIEPAGIARYWWHEEAKEFPSSHEEFVRERLASWLETGGSCD